MTQYLIEDFFLGIRRNFLKQSLIKWKRTNKKLKPEALKAVKPEYKNAASKMYIRRCFEIGDIFVDLYWYIKPSEEERHVDYIYYRCNWTRAKKLIKKVETKELPERINYAFDGDLVLPEM